MPETHVLVLHNDGRWYRAQLLGQHRDRATRSWRVGAWHYVGVGMQHQRVTGPTSAGLWTTHHPAGPIHILHAGPLYG